MQDVHFTEVVGFEGNIQTPSCEGDYKEIKMLLEGILTCNHMVRTKFSIPLSASNHSIAPRSAGKHYSGLEIGAYSFGVTVMLLRACLTH